MRILVGVAAGLTQVWYGLMGLADLVMRVRFYASRRFVVRCGGGSRFQTITTGGKRSAAPAPHGSGGSASDR
ncbi:hypothetical protein ACFX1T_005796 [Malus domestica]